jgi:hypothetical protein
MPVILSYAGGRDQEITVQSQPRQIVCKTLSQKTYHTHTQTKMAGGVAQCIDAEFKLQYCKKQNSYNAELVYLLVSDYNVGLHLP